MSRGRLTLYEFRDSDLLAKLAREGGRATSHEFAEVLGMREDVQSVAIRSSWLREYGALVFDKETREWSLSDMGERVVEANSRASRLAVEIAKLPEAELIQLMAEVTARYRAGDVTTARLVKREFVYGTTEGSAAYRTNGRPRRRR